MDNMPGQEDYFSGYTDNIDKLRQEGKKFELDKICFKVFGSEEGQELLEYIKEKVVMASVPAQMGEGYREACVYYEGYREAYRQLIHAVKAYPLRKEAEEKANL